MGKLLLEMISDLMKCSTRKCMKVKVHVHFPRSKIISESSYPIKSYIVNGFFSENWIVFVSIKKSKNNNFAFCFQLRIFPMPGVIFTSER